VTRRIPVYLEVTRKRTFAGALEWPGWCRSGKTPDDALEALVAYADRYAAVIAGSELGFERPSSVDDFEVVERLEGTATTVFGAPGVAPDADGRPLDAKELERLTAILEASWHAFDQAAAQAVGVTLTKGPRGGGRDLPKMESHVLETDEGYLAQLGCRPPRLPNATVAEYAAAVRATAVDALAARAGGRPVADPRQTKNPWSPRFYVRRAAWHALDHAWEIEDRS
jgi:hypothetical protein